MGIDVKVGERALNYVTDIGDIGAAPSEAGRHLHEGQHEKRLCPACRIPRRLR